MHIWDTPCPPALEDSILYSWSGAPEFCRHLRVTDPRSLTGITIFICRGTFGIHAHSSRYHTANSTFDQLNSEQRRSATWVYIPLPAEDRVEAFGFEFPQPKEDKAFKCVV